MPRKTVKEFWSNPSKVAEELPGKVMILGDQEVIIRKAQGFSREEGLRGIYLPMLDMEPGQFYCPRLGAYILPVIAVLDNGKRGGRVLIREIDVNGRVYSGPGRVAQQLGLTSKARGKITWLNEQTFRVLMEG